MSELAPTPRRTLSPKLTSWRRYALCLMGSLLAGCTLIAPIPTLPTPVRPPEIQSTADALQAALDGEFPLDATTIRYEVGNPVWEGEAGEHPDFGPILDVLAGLAYEISGGMAK